MPNSVAVYVTAADLDARHGAFAKASEELDTARAKFGDVSLSAWLAAPLRCANRVIGRGRRNRQTGRGYRAVFLTDDKIQLLGGLFGDLKAIKEFDRAKAIRGRLSELQPHDAMIRYRLLELDLATHNYRDPDASLAELDRLLGEIGRPAGRGPIWCTARPCG